MEQIIGVVERVVDPMHCLLRIQTKEGEKPFLATINKTRNIKSEDKVIAKRYLPFKLFGEITEKI